MISRRAFATAVAGGAAAVALGGALAATAAATGPDLGPIRYVTTDLLTIAYHEWGPANGEVVLLGHGWPYSPYAYAEVAPALARRGYRVLVPYLRGNGPTVFRSADTIRSGQQAALGADVIAFMDALGIRDAIFAGYAWGVRGLWPERCTGLVSVNSYLIQNLAPTSTAPRRCSPTRTSWTSPSTCTGTACSPSRATRATTTLEARLLAQPRIQAPAVTLDGLADGVIPPTDGSSSARYFAGPRVHHRVAGAGHNLPQEQPRAFAAAVLEVAGLR